MQNTTLYRGLPGDGLDTFIRKYRDAASEDPFGTWLILPTKRLVLKTVRELADAGTAALSSHICTSRTSARSILHKIVLQVDSSAGQSPAPPPANSYFS